MDAHREGEENTSLEAPEGFRGGLIAAAVGAWGAEPLSPEAWEKSPGQEPDAEEEELESGKGSSLDEAFPSLESTSPRAILEADVAQIRPELSTHSLAPVPPQEDVPAIQDRVEGAPTSGEASSTWWQGEAAPEWAPEAMDAEQSRPAAELDPIALTLAPLFHQGYVPRRSAPRLMDPEVRSEAERRLNAVGLSLAWSPYSRHVGLSLAEGTSGGRERISNLRELDRNALALLVILWARLVLPQRLAAEGREGGMSDPVVSFEALNAEFGKKLGGRRFEMYLAQLKRLGFLEYTRKDELRAGPFLDLLGDAQALASYLRQSALAHLLRGVEAQSADEVPSEEEGDEEASTASSASVSERSLRHESVIRAAVLAER